METPAGFDLFATLSPSAIAAFQQEAARLEVLAGGSVLEIGTPVDGIYRVNHGLLEAVADSAPNALLLSEIGPGRIVGEIAILAGDHRPASATVRAVRDTILSRLPWDKAMALVARDASFAAALGRIAVLNLATTPTGKRPSVSAFLPLADDPRLEALAAEAAARMGTFGQVDVLGPEDVRAAFGDPALTAPPGSALHMEITAWLDERLSDAERQHLLVGSPAAPAWSYRCARHAHTAWLAGVAEHGPEVTPLERTLRASLPDTCRPTMVLAGALRGGAVAAWLEGRPERDLYHLPRGVDDAHRLPSDRLRTHDDLVSDLEMSPVLQQVGRRALDEVATAMRIESLDGGEQWDGEIVQQGWVFVLRGRVHVRCDERDEGRFGPGELVLPRVSGASSRGRTLAATRDATLGVIGPRSVARLLGRHPELNLAVGMGAALRASVGEPKLPVERKSCMTLLPLGDADWSARADRIVAKMDEYGSARVVRRQDAVAALGEEAANLGPGDLGEGLLRGWFARLEDTHDFLLFLADGEMTPWTAQCVRQADHLLLGATDTADPAVGRVEAEAITLRGTGIPLPVHLLLWADRDDHVLSGTAAWIDCRPGAAWYHLRGDRPGDLRRLVRRLLGRAVGVVFGGASTRGVAHLGVWEAMAARGLDVDVISGASSGGALAVMLCQELPLDRVIDLGVRMVQGFDFRLRNMGPPLVSVLSGRSLERLLHDLYGDARLEDQPIPTRLSATDLQGGDLLCLDRGLIRDQVRVAIGLPAIWPPVVRDGMVLVDGGLLDNFPARFLHRDCCRGLTVVSNLDADFTEPFPHAMPSDGLLSGWAALWEHLRPGGSPERLPHLSAVIMQAMLAGSRLSQKQHTTGNDPHVVVLKPSLGQVDMFGVRDLDFARVLADRARAHALEVLEGWGPDGRIDQA